jgi:PST family polysaccharide transporter
LLIKKIRNKINSGNTNKILKNVFSLFILQGSNYILPLVLLPYLIRTLGIEYFGLLAFATATVNILRGIVSYGFDLSATKEISQNSDNKEKLRELFNSVILAKFLLSILTLFLLIILVSYFDKFNVHYEIFLITFILVFGDILFPIWFFQGIEKMKFITYIRVGYKIIFVFLVIALVNNPEDFWLVPLIDGIGSILAGLFSLYIINKNHQIYFSTINFPKAINQLKEGWHIFISKFAVIFYSSANTFVLGILSTNENVGFYSIAEKIYLALRGGLSPITQAVYPHLSKVYKENKDSYYSKIKKISIVYFLIIFAISLILFFFSSSIVRLVSGKEIYETQRILEIFAIAFLFAIGGLYSTLLIIKNQGKILSKITIYMMIINLLLVYPTIQFWGIYGLACLFTFIQFLQFTLQLSYNKEIYKGKL